MGDRILVHEREEDDDLGVTYHLIVQRSSLGRPGGFVSIARVQEGGDEEELSIQLEDLRVLSAAVGWADGASPP